MEVRTLHRNSNSMKHDMVIYWDMTVSPYFPIVSPYFPIVSQVSTGTRPGAPGAECGQQSSTSTSWGTHWGGCEILQQKDGGCEPL